MTFDNYSSPPEAPIFYPTCDEFADPLEYIEKIRPIASRAGLCKIIPPKVNTFEKRVYLFYKLISTLKNKGMATAILC
jgi:hypothetical protein